MGRPLQHARCSLQRRHPPLRRPPRNSTLPPRRRLRLFELFPVLLGIAVTWIIAAILTASGTYDNASPGQQASCKTNNLTVLNNSPWIRFPYPGKKWQLRCVAACTLPFHAPRWQQTA